VAQVSVRNMLRRIRRRASKVGCTLQNFRQPYGVDSDLGPEWMARSVRYPHLAVLVWRPIGDDAIEEAKRTCDEVIVTRGFSNGKAKEAFGVSWFGRWPDG